MATESTSPGTPAPSLIASVVVTRLFGCFNYELAPRPDSAIPSLMILYGDNGSGKTTVLNLVISTLSPTQHAGYRHKLLRIPFQAFRVRLATGVTVSVERPPSTVLGGYRMSIERSGASVATVDVIQRPSGEIEIAADRYAQFCQALEELVPEVVFLSDDRHLRTAFEEQESVTWSGPDRPARRPRRGERFAAHQLFTSPEERPPPSPLDVALERARSAIRDQALRGMSVGNQSSHAIYSELAHRIASMPAPATADVAKRSQEVVSSLERIARRHEQLVTLKLAPTLDTRLLVEAIGAATAQTWPLLARVLEPYLDSLTAMHDALEPVRRRLESLVGLSDSREVLTPRT